MHSTVIVGVEREFVIRFQIFRVLFEKLSTDIRQFEKVRKLRQKNLRINLKRFKDFFLITA
jgi:hypothetical protein